MESWVKQFPHFLHHGFLGSKGRIPSFQSKYRPEVVFCGMGGSAIGGMLIKNFFPDLPCPIRVHMSDGLPHHLQKNAYIVVVSYSGNTEEALSSFHAMQEQRRNGIVITSGGQLLKYIKENNTPWLPLPSDLPPRAALPFILSAELMLLEQLTGKSLKASALQAAGFLQKHQKKIREKAERIARSIHQHAGTILIWGIQGVSDAIAYRWRTQLNENAKQFASTHNFPELTHNEIVPLSTATHPFTILTLETDFDGNRNVLRRKNALKLLGASSASSSLLQHTPVQALGKTRLTQLLSLLWMGDWVSLHLAKLLNIDPLPISAIEKLKERMKHL